MKVGSSDTVWDMKLTVEERILKALVNKKGIKLSTQEVKYLYDKYIKR